MFYICAPLLKLNTECRQKKRSKAVSYLDSHSLGTLPTPRSYRAQESCTSLLALPKTQMKRLRILNTIGTIFFSSLKNFRNWTLIVDSLVYLWPRCSDMNLAASWAAGWVSRVGFFACPSHADYFLDLLQVMYWATIMTPKASDSRNWSFRCAFCHLQDGHQKSVLVSAAIVKAVSSPGQ